LVLFAGNIGYAAGLENVVETAEELRQEQSIRFLIVGEGSAKEDLVRAAHEEGLGNIEFLTTQPEQDVATMISSADVGLVTLRRGMGGLSVPSKTLAYMAGACPVLASVPVDSEVSSIVRESGCGLVVPAEDPGELARGLLEMAQMGERRLRAMGEMGRTFVERRYERRIIVRRHRDLLQKAAAHGLPQADGWAKNGEER
jgi:glycosyltransferase involved in cell wall biosynthesis